MQLKSTKRKNQEYFASWDKKIETTRMRMLADVATPLIIFMILNVFTIIILVKLNIYNFNL